jgi:hypothetical protein
MKNPHTELILNAIVALGARPDLGKFWRQDNGLFRLKDSPDTLIKVGLPGSADIGGILNDKRGRVAQCEGKTGNAVQQKNQVRFQAMIESYGGFYLVFRSVPSLISSLEQACKN